MYNKLKNESNYRPVGRNFNAMHLSKFIKKFEEKNLINPIPANPTVSNS